MSAVEVEILGDGRFAGSVANIEDYSISEYGSPLSLTDLQAGVGTIGFSVVEDPSFNGSMLLPGQPFEIRDPWAGRQRGLIDDGTAIDEYMLDVGASGALLPLVSQREAEPFSGTLGGAITYYCGLCGVTTGFQFDPAISFIAVNLPRWKGDVWQQLKKLQAIHQFEMADVAGTIVIRKLRLRTVEMTTVESSRLRYGRTGASQIVEVHYYNNQHQTNVQVFPDPKSSIVDRNIISIGAGETSVNNVDVNMWVESIDPPEQVSSLPWDNTSVTSVYAVVDKDGNPVSVTDWTNGGGLVTFAVGADGKSVDVTVRGMSTQSRAPYRIASSSADREYQYAALYIAATGISFEDKMIWSHTGADIVDAPSDAVTVIDEPMVSTREEAAVVLANAIRDNMGFSQELEINAATVNRRGETGQTLYPTFAQWNAEHPAMTFAQFAVAYDNVTFEQYTTLQGAAFVNAFDSQAFGGIGGARTRFRDNVYRIRQATARPSGFSWTAQGDLVFSEWNSDFVDTTFAAFNARWTGKTFEQHARMPLAGNGTWVESRRNLSLNPQGRGGVGATGWTGNNNAVYPVTRGVTPPVAHPLGIATAVSNRNATGAVPTLASVYNADGLGSAATPARSLAVWVLVTEPGYRMMAGSGGLTWPADELPVNVWTYVESLTPVASGNFATVYVQKIDGNASTTAWAYYTGLLTIATAPPAGAYFDGSIPSSSPSELRNRWLGVEGLSESVQETFIPRIG